MKFRHEWKHEISYIDKLSIFSRLSNVMQLDAHAVDGKYKIRSIYFDNYQDKALREKIDGYNIREKFRIRYYNDDISSILLEKKSKFNGLCSKEQQIITLDEAQAIITVIFMNGEKFCIKKASAVKGYETKLFDTSTVHSINIVMDDWEEFILNCTDEEYVNCTVIIDNETYKNIAIRAKGN